MLKNYLKIALRNLLKQKLYSFINLSGFAIAIGCCLLLFLFIHNEWTYDRFHRNANRIFRVIKVDRDFVTGERTKQAITPAALGPALLETFPEIGHAVRFTWGGGIFKYNDVSDRETGLLVDPAIFKMFSFELLRGNPNTVLEDKRSIVVSQEMAVKYFGSDDPVGKVLKIMRGQNSYEFTVTGVLGRIPENSSLKFKFLLPIEFKGETEGKEQLADWRISNCENYIQLHSSDQAEPLQQKLPPFVAKHFPQPIDALVLQPLRDIHLNTAIQGGVAETSHPAYSYILGAIALLILLLACVNFMNLAIGQSSVRVKEIGVRKVMGAHRAQLIRQFLSEAIMMSFLALAFGMLFAELFLPTFNRLTEKNLSIWEYTSWASGIFLCVFLLVAGTLAGGYPALLLSSFQAVEVIKSRFKFSGSNLFSRVLIVFQFCVSIFLMISTIVMHRQLRFMTNKDLGYNGEQVVVISGDPDIYEVYKNEIMQHKGILAVTSASGSFEAGGVTISVPHEGKNMWMRVYAVDHNFFEVLEIPILRGRNFRKEIVTDAQEAVIVNETFVKTYGMEDPIGKQLPPFQGLKNPTIIGVVKDFHFRPLYFPIEPLALHFRPSFDVFVKISPIDMQGTLAYLKKKWNEIAPDRPFRYYFLDEYVDRQYKEIERVRTIVGYASILAIFIAGLGLLGLALLSAVRRTKEIGIRKVLGANVLKIITLLSKDFLKLVLLANVIVWPLAYFAMQKFLQFFAYRIDLGFLPFLLAGVIALMIALVTVSSQALKAALANPVEALRYE